MRIYCACILLLRFWTVDFELLIGTGESRGWCWLLRSRPAISLVIWLLVLIHQICSKSQYDHGHTDYEAALWGKYIGYMHHCIASYQLKLHSPSHFIPWWLFRLYYLFVDWCGARHRSPAVLYVRSHINVACSHLHFMKVIINVPIIGLSGHCFTARSVRQ